jgi:2-keto-4-pentenoate hydratase/2-oxohepta-3-ene-1,7-dioic acid hydratase in catechol pathway
MQPGKIVCIGRNYAAHARELGNAVPERPLIFLKPPSAVIGNGAAILLPPDSARVEHEAEIAVVIGRRARHVAEAEALSCVAGYAPLNDVTARDLQRLDVQFDRAKGYDTFCPIGASAVALNNDWRALEVVCRVNGQERQRGTAGDMVFSIPALIAYISRVMTLDTGDVIATGTPAGTAPLRDGDTVEVEIIGLDSNAIIANPVRIDVRARSHDGGL